MQLAAVSNPYVVILAPCKEKEDEEEVKRQRGKGKGKSQRKRKTEGNHQEGRKYRHFLLSFLASSFFLRAPCLSRVLVSARASRLLAR